ncbi:MULTISPECIES: TRAP transporter substrate-binding protein [unclassified Halomonas]|uniref:TRAP transporter substrate-binding protein n=1 Tax=unclassified Halomonas TaxID=2609666 RepID=UPI0021E40B9A|nr:MULTISPECIES: TRAP transporter substrate-binding protein [unclassified Halomonas]UYG00864.1 TRAP transporter substrate-binding protein [Halomonas sp. GD1P12]WNL38073.1 TRAP transporter substrate-binding protein [Halomonas sp. PAMB 3232]WNL41398.1 TRAP transporter substrate-binding protein [Halomonas sp. PAMB 3264]
MTKRSISTLAVLGAVTMMGATPALAETLRIGTVVSAPHPWIDAAEAFKAEIEEATDNRITVQIFPGGQIGNDQTMVDEIRIGTTDMIIGGVMNVSPYVPDFEIFSLNYLFEDMDTFRAATAPDSPVFEYFDNAVTEADVGLKLLSLTGGGTRNLSTNVGPVTEPSDLEGVKMRVTGSRLDADMWQAYGALTTSLPWTEIYTGMQTGVVGAFESTISGYFSSRLYEVAPYHAKTEHQIMMSHISIGENRFNRFSEEDQALILEAAQHAGELGTDKGEEYDAEFIQQFEELGVTVTEVDKQAFIDRALPLHDEFAEERGLTELLETIRAL